MNETGLIIRGIKDSQTFVSIICCCCLAAVATLRNPTNCSVPISLSEIFQAEMLEWVAIPFPMGSSQPRDQTWVSFIVGRFFSLAELYYPTIKMSTYAFHFHSHQHEFIHLSHFFCMSKHSHFLALQEVSQEVL